MLRPPTHGARASVPRANAAACRTGTPWEEEPSPLALSQVGSVQSRGLGFFWAGVVRRHHRLQTVVLRSMHNCVIRYKCPPHRTVSCKCGSKMLMVRLDNDVSLAHSVPLQARSQQMFCLQNTQRENQKNQKNEKIKKIQGAPAGRVKGSSQGSSLEPLRIRERRDSHGQKPPTRGEQLSSCLEHEVEEFSRLREGPDSSV